MTKEQLRMQMLAGIITESQYKAKLEEEDTMGKIGKSYSAPSTPGPIKNIQQVISDIPRKKIFLGKSNDPEWDGQMVYFDDKDPFYAPLGKYTEGGEGIECLNRIPSMSRHLYPISENPNITPLDINLLTIYKILSGAGPIIPLRNCPDYMNDSDGQYILIEYKGGQGYISRGGVSGLRQGTNYNLGMGFVFTLLD